MIEDMGANAAGRGEHKIDAFGVIDPPHLVLVIEIALRRARLDQRDPLAVKIETVGDRPHVMDRHDMRLGPGVAARLTRGRLVGQIVGLRRHWRDIGQDAVDLRQALDHLRGEAHGVLPGGGYRR